MSRGELKTSLSKGLLSMRFMQKSKQKLEKEKEVKESQSLYASEITDEMKKEVTFITELSRGACEDVIKGRLSFGGINPEIERIMAEEAAALAAERDKRLETSISDESMAEHYVGVSRTFNKKFQKYAKRHKQDENSDSSKKKKKFLKPVDDD